MVTKEVGVTFIMVSDNLNYSIIKESAFLGQFRIVGKKSGPLRPWPLKIRGSARAGVSRKGGGVFPAPPFRRSEPKGS
jgi:hypothetical protein